MNKSAIDWLFCGTDQFWKLKVTYKDIPDHSPDARYDAVKEGYWIRNDSKLATILALKGVKFTGRWGQSVW